LMSFIIGLGVILFLGIIYLIFKLSTLVSVAKGQKAEKERLNSDNSINAALFVIFMVVGLVAFFWYSYVHFDGYNLPVASKHGVLTDNLFWITMAVTVIAFTVIFIVMFYFLYKYRYQEGRKATYLTDNHFLELIWTVIPAIVLAVLIFKGLNTWNDITGPASKEAEVIELVGQQFAWVVRYPGKDNQLGKTDFRMIDGSNEFGLNLEADKNTYDDFKSLELHIPKDKEVLLKIRAKDVLHSVYLPHFRVKMDAVPGMQTQFKFTADKSTAEMRKELKNANFNYELACAEVCGRGHFSMRMIVIVEEEREFNAWKDSQEAWLKQNPDYLKRVPAALREAAMIKAGIPVEAGAAAMQGNAQTVVGSN
jgi:cytochrome c oxidase subunit 2